MEVPCVRTGRDVSMKRLRTRHGRVPTRWTPLCFCNAEWSRASVDKEDSGRLVHRLGPRAGEESGGERELWPVAGGRVLREARLKRASVGNRELAGVCGDVVRPQRIARLLEHVEPVVAAIRYVAERRVATAVR